MKRGRSLDNGSGSSGGAVKKGKQAVKSANKSMCIKCKTACNSGLQCDICDNCMHYACCGINDTNRGTIEQVVQVLGWTCANCKSSMRKLLVSGPSSTLDDITSIKEKVNELNEELKACKVTPSTNATNVFPSIDTDHSTSGWTEVTKKITKQVHTELNRRRNVVVSGVDECADASGDKSAFVNLCHVHLNISPRVTFTKRLGTHANGRGPRRLLVGLASEDEALNLIGSSKNLRSSSDRTIASKVYINRHLSPDEAKRDYERRQSKRERRYTASLQGTSTSTRLNPSAAPFNVVQASPTASTSNSDTLQSTNSSLPPTNLHLLQASTSSIP